MALAILTEILETVNCFFFPSGTIIHSVPDVSEGLFCLFW